MCIDATTRAACDYGLQCQVIHDACASRNLVFEGMEVPAGVTLKVVEDTGAVRHLVLPAAKRLDDESLDAVTGGLFADCQGSDTPADWCRIYGNG